MEHDLQRLGAKLLADAPPVTTAEVLAHRHGATSSHDRESVEIPVVAEGASPTRSPRRRSVPIVGGIAAASLLVVGLGVATSLSGDDEPTAVGTDPAAAADTSPATTPGASPAATAATPVGAADVSWPPRVLLDDSWEIVDVNERSVNEGYMTFARDGVSVHVGWYRGQVISDDWYSQEGFTEAGTETMLGEPVTIYASPPMFATSELRELIETGRLESELIESELEPHEDELASRPETEPVDDVFIGGPMLEAELAEAVEAGLIDGVSNSLEARLVWDHTSLSVQIRPADPASEPALDDIVAVLEALHQVESTEWEAALPDNIVTPAARPAVIDEMTTGVPIPDMFSVDVLGDQELVQSRGVIADAVVKHVACAWLDRYYTTTDGDDDAAAAEALAAIDSIGDWPVSQELAEAIDNTGPGMIGIPNSGLLSLTVNADGTITYEGTGEVLTEGFATTLCYVDAAG